MIVAAMANTIMKSMNGALMLPPFFLPGDNKDVFLQQIYYPTMIPW
jgi:hypothetical protein